MKIYWSIKFHGALNDGHFFNFFHKSESTDINQDLVDKWIYHLTSIDCDFCTLNPIILNFLDDDFAKENVYVRTKSGIKKLGDIKEVQFKFRAFGPGEVVCDTDFSTLE